MTERLTKCGHENGKSYFPQLFIFEAVSCILVQACGAALKAQARAGIIVTALYTNKQFYLNNKLFNSNVITFYYVET